MEFFRGLLDELKRSWLRHEIPFLSSFLFS
jgi:hypothetical protein